MREILFRGFHPDENGNKTITLNGKKIRGEWVEGDLIQTHLEYSDGEKGIDCEIRTRTIGVDLDSFDGGYMAGSEEKVLPETVGQYIGLTDKNGNRIFEGDIVQAIVLYSNTIRHAVVGIGECVDNEGDTCFGANLSWEGVVGIYYAEYLNYIEHIGNIYENPELLGVEQ